MRYFVAALILFMASCGTVAPAQVETNHPGVDIKVNADGSVTMALSPAVAEACAMQGGCALVSKDWVLDQIGAACGSRI